MDKIDKALLKLSAKQRTKLMQAFALVIKGDIKGLQIKKLKGHQEIYRLRVGDTRLIFRKGDDKPPVVLHLSKRD